MGKKSTPLTPCPRPKQEENKEDLFNKMKMKTGFLCPGVSSFIQAKPKDLHITYYKNSYESCIGRLGSQGVVLKITSVLLKCHILIGKQIQT